MKDWSYRCVPKMIRFAHGRREKRGFDFTRQVALLNAVNT
jgi:hypothetical protein